MTLKLKLFVLVMMILIKYIIFCEKLIDLNEYEIYLYNRIKNSKYIFNPYPNLNISQICSGTSFGFSSGRNEYKKLKLLFQDCVYLDGNLEINNFNPYYSETSPDSSENDHLIDKEYDFSFLDSIQEITGYLLIHNTRLKSLRLKNLKLIRGKTLFQNKYSIYIDSNSRLESIDLSKLTEIQSGSVHIFDNSALCSIDKVNWNDLILSSKQTIFVTNNAQSKKCFNCLLNCCDDLNAKNCGCWSKNTCQNISKLNCDQHCDNRCFIQNNKHGCCDNQCVGGCNGPSRKDCFACKNFRIYETGECVDSCPKIQMVDPITGDLIYNPKGMYQYGFSCVRTCPSNLFIYQELCLPKCPNMTYEDEEMINNPETGEKGMKRLCKLCTVDKCPKICSISKIDNKDLENTRKDLKSLINCEILNSNLLILQPLLSENKSKELDEKDFEVLSSIRTINGFIRIQSNSIKSLHFLRNLEIIRPPKLDYNKYSMVILSDSLETLGLNKLKRIERGDVVLKADNLCLYDTINWTSILNSKNSIHINDGKNDMMNEKCTRRGFKCDKECIGCWSTGANSCQFCKTFKIADKCIDKCEGYIADNRYAYLSDKQERQCKLCNSECSIGCTGPSEYECLECKNYKIRLNETLFKCIKSCPSTHYLDKNSKTCLPCSDSCYGCTGPKNTLGEDGCKNCNSALVDNDASYSVLKCIIKEEYNCSFDHFLTVVPDNLVNHKLKGKTVCRKCNSECDGCFSNGALLNINCKKCTNNYSLTRNECVSNCFSHNEYLKNSTNICLPCSIECKFGCSGLGTYECNECKSFKLYLKDIKKILKYLIRDYKLELNSNLYELSNSLIDYLESNDHVANTMNDTNDKDNMISLLRNYRNYLDKKYSIDQIDYINTNIDNDDHNDDNVVFCVSECPIQLPYKTNDLFCTSNKSNGLKHLIILLILIIIFMLVVLFYIVYKYMNKKNKIYLQNEEKYFGTSDNDDDNEEQKQYEEENVYVKSSLEEEKEKMNTSNLTLIADNELEKCSLLGNGAFGIVYEGYLKPNGCEKLKFKVAIKELNPFSNEISFDKIKELENEIINEATVMASVKHKYCLQLRGLCLAKSIKLVTQLLPLGSAVNFLQKHKKRVNEKMLLIWSEQIAEGMEYLESKGIVHRDLAARNILIKSLEHIKITDFGLAKVLDSDEKVFYAKTNSLLPIKWLAIESIVKREFNHKTDVWSYGVCLWELYTFCTKPYQEIENKNIIDYLEKGVRLAKPPMASVWVYKILIRCWLEKPYTRPNFKELKEEFSKMVYEPKRYLCLENVDDNLKFTTISENKQDLIQNIQNDSLDLYDMDDDYDDSGMSEYNKLNKSNNSSYSHDKRKIKSVSNNSNNSPDEGIDLNSFDHTNSLSNNNKLTRVDSNYNKSLIIFKRTPTASSQESNNFFKNMFTEKKIKRLKSEISTNTGSTYVSSLYSGSNSDDLSRIQVYDEDQQNLIKIDQTTKSGSSNSSNLSSNNSFIYKLKPNSDYLEPVPHNNNIKQNFEYFRTDPKSIIIIEQN